MQKVFLFIILSLSVTLLSAQPVTGCYWEWMNGNISKEGITKDLEYMKAVGIEMVNSYGLLLAGEPYGNGDFDREQYGMSFDLPMSEYWARCHYGSIERPMFVSRYGHAADSVRVLTDYIHESVETRKKENQKITP
ncbi:MAG: hypothetical protein IJV52_07125 [Prevotella sp.]|nr:hypothetical protein [Prevotella sp.]